MTVFGCTVMVPAPAIGHHVAAADSEATSPDYMCPIEETDCPDGSYDWGADQSYYEDGRPSEDLSPSNPLGEEASPTDQPTSSSTTADYEHYTYPDYTEEHLHADSTDGHDPQDDDQYFEEEYGYQYAYPEELYGYDDGPIDGTIEDSEAADDDRAEYDYSSDADIEDDEYSYGDYDEQYDYRSDGEPPTEDTETENRDVDAEQSWDDSEQFGYEYDEYQQDTEHPIDTEEQFDAESDQDDEPDGNNDDPEADDDFGYRYACPDEQYGYSELVTEDPDDQAEMNAEEDAGYDGFSKAYPDEQYAYPGNAEGADNTPDTVEDTVEDTVDDTVEDTAEDTVENLDSADDYSYYSDYRYDEEQTGEIDDPADYSRDYSWDDESAEGDPAVGQELEEEKTTEGSYVPDTWRYDYEYGYSPYTEEEVGVADESDQSAGDVDSEDDYSCYESWDDEPGEVTQEVVQDEENEPVKSYGYEHADTHEYYGDEYYGDDPDSRIDNGPSEADTDDEDIEQGDKNIEQGDKNIEQGDDCYDDEWDEPGAAVGSDDSETVESGLELFTRLPGELLSSRDQQALRELERSCSDPSGVRRAALNDYLEELGAGAIGLAVRLEDTLGITVLSLADDMPGAAALLAAFRLIERGELRLEEAVDLLERSLPRLSRQWIDGVWEITATSPENPDQEIIYYMD